MTIADEARANAIPCEMVLYAYRKNKDGVVVSFVVHPDEVPDALATARIGSRWVGALVQVGDDELPVRAKEKPAKPPATPKPTAGGKRNWRDIPPPQQAGIRCDDATFSAFLKEERPDDWSECQDTVDCVYLICGISSRSELGTNQKARVIWHQLDEAYQAWKALENA